MFIDGDTFRVPPAVASLAPLITGSPKIPAKKLQPYLVSESTPPLLKPWEAGWALLDGCRSWSGGCRAGAGGGTADGSAGQGPALPRQGRHRLLLNTTQKTREETQQAENGHGSESSGHMWLLGYCQVLGRWAAKGSSPVVDQGPASGDDLSDTLGADSSPLSPDDKIRRQPCFWSASSCRHPPTHRRQAIHWPGHVLLS